jgi:hypothetical protein
VSYGAAVKLADRSSTTLAVIAVAAGAGLGVASQLAVRSLPHPANLAGTLGGPWLATAFALGVAARSRRPAAWAGAVSMAVAMFAYYVVRKVMNQDLPGGYTVRGEAIPYVVIGLIAGGGMAVLGASWRKGGTRWKGVAAGLLAGALGAEVLVLMSRSWRGPEQVFAVVQGGAAFALAWVLPRGLRGRLVALVVGIGSALVFGGAILALDLPLRLFH